MKPIRFFFTNLSRLLRESETQALEFVMGLIAFDVGLQFFLGLLGLTTSSALLRAFPFPLEFLISLGLIAGALAKITGAVLNHQNTRMYAALIHASIWFALFVANISHLTIYTIIFILILAFQSSWIYIRLSLLRKQSRVP